MDIARPEFKRRRRRRQIIYGVSSLIGLALVTMGLQRLQPAAPLVENALLGTVERGPFVRKVRGNGTLVPEEIRLITAAYAGRIEELPIKVGAAVKTQTILVKLSNPELEQAAFDAEWTLKAAEAQWTNLTVTLASQRLTQQAAVAMAEANYNRAKVEAEVNEELAKIDLVPALTLKQSKTNAAELKRLSDIEHERLRISASSTAAQLAVQEAQVRQLRAQLELKRQQVEALKVRAGIDGVLQKLGDQSQLQIGQQVAAGSLVARVTNPKKLMAELKIPETQARDVELDQIAEVDTRNGFVPGRVVRKDPAAQNGTVTVDIALTAPLPRGAVPELNVDGTVFLEKLDDIIYVGRPVQGQSDSTVGLFKVVEGGKAAVRVPVKLGRNSVSEIEVVEGLQVGDQVILSDMSAWDAFQRVRIK
ncbi:MAG: HlyD family efflux transporter periplasmic adaptor subunit [Verrucomicrobia bacterium]|nr:HlyD family efflux transporter periplasmic adaptor subunit [Verrucomicrobiota bacterium]